MKLDKIYLYSEFGNFFFMAFLIFSFLFLIRPFLWFMDIIINHFFTPGTVTKFFILSWFESGSDIVALSFLAAISGTIARMNMENEYRIFLISGIPPKQILNHFVIFSILFIIIEFCFCFFISPSASYSRKLLLSKARLDEPMKIFKNKSLIREFPGVTIYVENVERTKLTDISISYREGLDFVYRIQAKSGSLATDRRGYIYLFLKNGFIETYSIEGRELLYRISFDAYSFTLPYRRAINFLPNRRIKEMTLPLLIKGLFSLQDEKKDMTLVLVKKTFFTFLPLFYLFFGFYTGIGIKASGYFQVLGTGVAVGLISYFIILIGEVIAYKSGSVTAFLIVPSLFILGIITINKIFSHVA